ncbi:MAG: alkaline phosphatase family protein [Anaerolineales bacterium]|nr:alkaline phosphatase family protein [Anaerolineales bacterium]
MNKVILILSDGLRYDTAVDSMGYLGHLVETKQASLYKVTGELPSLSRPIYETIHTGLLSSEHGILGNAIVHLSTKPNIFQLAKDAGKVTAAAAYSWFSELYNRTPYNRIEDKEIDDTSLSIQHGRFYTEDDYPDAELFASAAWLVRKYSPDYLLVHPMGMDYHGETYGSDSKEYRNHAIRQDMYLVSLLLEWQKLGYHILVTSDHGMNKDGAHGGTTSEVRDVPLYMIRQNVEERGDTHETVSQLQIAPTILKLLNIKIPDTMKHLPID